MLLAPVSTLFFFILLFLLNESAISTSRSNDYSKKRTAYEILQSYNFPVGLLPKGFTKYDLDKKTGQFHAYRDGSCSFSLEGSYQLKYKSTISGYISKNRLTGLTGVSVKVLFLWLNIVEVARNGDRIQFSVGFATSSFLIDNFYVCPQCGCGLVCVNGHDGINLNHHYLLLGITCHQKKATLILSYEMWEYGWLLKKTVFDEKIDFLSASIN